MTDVIDFFFTLWGQMFQLITSKWLLSVFLLISIFSWIVDLINSSRSQK